MIPPEPWSAFAPAIHTTCEPAVAGWIVHPAETVSALAYLVAAGRSWRLAPAIALRIALVGLIAVGFHTSGTAFMQRIDLAVVALLNGHLLTWALIRNGYGTPAQALPMGIALAIFPAGIAFLFSWFGYFVATVGALTALVLWQRLARMESGIRDDVRWISWLVLPGGIVLGLGHLGIGCVSGAAAHIVQPHVIWHVVSAAACAIICRMDRTLRQSTNLPPPMQ